MDIDPSKPVPGENLQEKNGVIIAIDVDNLMIAAAKAGQKSQGYDMEFGFKKMIDWVRTFGNILCMHLYMPATQSMSDILWHKLWETYREEFLIEFIYCPKKRSESGGKRLDNVDDHLIDHTRKIANLFSGKVKYFCLASGDLDYSSLLWQLRREMNMEIAFALGSVISFSRAYRQMNITARHPLTGEELIYYFSPHKP